MQIKVKVIPKASRLLVREENGVIKVHLTKPAQDGLANEQLLKTLAEHFKVKRYNIRLIQGPTSRNKIVEIDDK